VGAKKKCPAAGDRYLPHLMVTPGGSAAFSLALVHSFINLRS